MTPEQKRARQEIAVTAAAMLDGTLSFIEGARQINSWRVAADLPGGEPAAGDPDLLAFIVIDSETDTLPFGDVRQLWQPAALAKLQPEIERSEKWAAEVGRDHAVNLVRRFGTQNVVNARD